MAWEILLFESKRGEKPVEEFIKKQQSQAKSKIIHNIRLLKEYGNQLGMPRSKILGNGLYELRIRGKTEIRIFYGFKRDSIYLLHAFRKQSQKTPQKELRIARERLSSLTKV